MPAPPRKNESKEKFLKRCIPYLIKNEGKNKKQASGQCYEMWRTKGGKK